MKVLRLVALMLTAGSVIWCGRVAEGAALDTRFTYQGNLLFEDNPADGFFDFQCALYTAEIAGSQVGSTVVLLNESVASGLVTFELDFGAGIFTGDELWLQIFVREHDIGVYRTLDPRTRVTATPYALFALDGGSITGQGTTNTVAKFTGATTIGDSPIFAGPTNVGIGTTTPVSELDVVGTITVDGLTVSGAVGIGTATPGAALEVVGQVKITGGSPGVGKVLASDANGLASWQTASSGVPSGAVMFFNLASCPGGWSEVLSARGRYLVGVYPSAKRGQVVGTPLSIEEDRPTGDHRHHMSFYESSVSGQIVSGQGNQVSTPLAAQITEWLEAGTPMDPQPAVGTNAPYMTFLACQKN